jgi:hypothetical protein
MDKLLPRAAKLNTVRGAACRVAQRNDNALPSELEYSNEKHTGEVLKNFPNIDTFDPSLVKARRLTEDPRAKQSKLEIGEANETDALTEREDPSVAWLSTDKCCESLAELASERPLPSRENCRTDNPLPRANKSKIDVVEPNGINARKDILEPILHVLIIDIESPTVYVPNNEKVDPSRM